MLHNEISTDTESLIKNAAKKVFLRKGLAGTRLQEIADEAGIGRTALHYYFRSKEKLFALVWKDFFSETNARIPQLIEDINMPIIERMQLFAGNYMDSALKNPELDLFMLNEFNGNAGMFEDILISSMPVNLSTHFIEAIQKAVTAGELVGEPRQIFLTMMSICIFPFAGMMMIKTMMNLSDDQFMNMMHERKHYVLKFLETAFKP